VRCCPAHSGSSSNPIAQARRRAAEPIEFPSRAPEEGIPLSAVNLRTDPPGSLLLRTLTEPPDSSVTSTQLPLEKLKELFT
jgi:hypothetical protein